MIIRTITRDLIPTDLGRINYHEHAFQVSPLLPGDELNNIEKSTEEFFRLKFSGFNSYVDATPIGLGRNLDGIKEVQSRTGLNVIHTTGVHRQAHYNDNFELLNLPSESLASIFKTEIIEGMRKPNGESSGLKAGLVKIGIGEEKITSFEERALVAASNVVNETGVGLMIHIEMGSLAHEVLDLLDELSCPLNRVALAHMDRKPVTSLHYELAERGVYLGYDGAGRTKYFPDEVLVKLFQELVELGKFSHILLGADVARASRYISYGGGPGLEYLGKVFLPKLINATDVSTVGEVLTSNPQKWLAFPN